MQNKRWEAGRLHHEAGRLQRSYLLRVWKIKITVCALQRGTSHTLAVQYRWEVSVCLGHAECPCQKSSAGLLPMTLLLAGPGTVQVVLSHFVYFGLQCCLQAAQELCGNAQQLPKLLSLAGRVRAPPNPFSFFLPCRASVLHLCLPL